VAAERATQAAEILDTQAPFHLNHARGLIKRAEDDLARATRQIDRTLKACGLYGAGEFKDIDEAETHIISEERGE
jgi:hypothetical protein